MKSRPRRVIASRSRGAEAPRPTRVVLRRIGIGPRLWLFVAVPLAALVVLIGLLVWSDIRTVDDLRTFETNTTEVITLVDARAAVQDERHDLLEPGNAETLSQRPLVEELLGADAVSLLAVNQSGVDVTDELLVARRLAQTGHSDEALSHYSVIIDAVDAEIASLVGASPDGEIDRRGDALIALLTAHEAMLLEDLELRIGGADPTTVVRLHATETEGLDRFARDASPSSQRSLERLTISRYWRTTVISRATFLDDPTGGIDPIRWPLAAEARRAALTGLVDSEAQGLSEATTQLASQGITRLLGLAGIVTVLLAIGALATYALHRSIVGPLGVLARAATRLSRGELAPIEDSASDEIARVAQAFSSLHDTMQSLFTDVAAVSSGARQEEFDKRIRTAELQGDWLRLAETMNAMLETGEQHDQSVRAELIRRDVLAEISSAALLADDAKGLTEVVLHHLPGAVPGSIARLHQHPSGPPLFDLGIELEPTISALELPALADSAQLVDLRGCGGVASLVDFGTGPPVVLVLSFEGNRPAETGPLLGLVQTAARVLAQGHRRQAAEWSAAHHFEHDALTGLLNSAGMARWFEERTSETAGHWTTIGIQPLRLDVLDSTYGRDARNTLLTIVSRRLRRAVEDIGIIARIGDPEFVMVIPRVRTEQLIEHVIGAFRNPLSVGHELVPVELTIGVAAIDDDLEQAIANTATAIRQVDERTTTVVYFDEEHRERAVHMAELERWLETAIAEGDFELHFQPVVDAVTTVTVGYEALIRGSRNGVRVSPGEFIPLAEETGAILEIGEFTLREACAALPFLPGNLPYVSVNLSPVELADPELPARMDAILEAAAVDRSRIVMEVTEGAATSEAGVQALHRIRGLGVKIAIDDFGTGHANLAYLATLPAEIVKIDRSLVTPMVHDKAARTVVAGAVSMAHDIGMTVIGEGVETNEELNALRRVRCDRVQGWLTGRPAPLEDLIEVTTSTERTRISNPGGTP